jgi:hypothetical protein
MTTHALVPEAFLSTPDSCQCVQLRWTHGPERRSARVISALSPRQPAGASPAPGDARVPGSAAPGGGRDPVVEAEQQSPCEGASNWPVRSMKRSLQRRQSVPNVGSRESRAGWQEAKAMDGTQEPGAGAQELPGVGGRGTARRLAWELERPSSAPSLRGTGSVPAYNRRPREVAGGREGVGGGRSSDDGRDNTTRPERRAPASSTQPFEGRGPDECRTLG